MGTRFRERGFSSGGKIVGSDGFSQNDIIWEVDFRRFPLSNGTNAGYHTSLLSSKGLTLARASSATVQTSTSTVVTTGIGVDAPRIGDAGYGQGLVIEEARTNLVPTSREFGGTGWSQGTGNFETGSYADGPDGSVLSADRLYRPDGLNYSDYVATAVTAGVTYTAGFWVRGTSGASMYSPYVADLQAGNVPVASSIWSRQTHTRTSAATATGYWQPLSGVPTTVIVDIVCDLHQLEAGKFPTEAIVTTSGAATRAGDKLTLARDITRNGRISLELQFIPKAARSSYSGSPVLWQSTASPNDLCQFAFNTGNLVCTVAGESTTLGTIDWAAGDVVDLWIECGGGGSTIAKYRRNNGVVTSLLAGAPRANIVAPSITIGSNYLGGANVSAWYKYARAYVPGRRPTWAA